MATDSPPGSIRITAGPEAAGQRLDRFLADAIGTLSRSRVKALIEAGAVSARRQPRPASPPNRCAPAPPTRWTCRRQPRPGRSRRRFPFTILYEDADLIVLDKPAGLVVHPAPGNQDGTLVNALLAHCGPDFTGIGAERRPGIVHRLDKDTSGVMVVAKTQLASDVLTAAFAARDLDRAYLALAWGVPSPLAGEIEGAIGRDPRDRKRMAVVARGGKPALTRYRTLQAWHAAVALLECRLATGRTHQIRVHLASRGHPDRRRSALPAPHSRGGAWACPNRCAGPCWTSRARRCMRPASASPIPRTGRAAAASRRRRRRTCRRCWTPGTRARTSSA